MKHAWMLYIIGSMILMAFLKRCDPAKGHSIYSRRKGWRE